MTFCWGKNGSFSDMGISKNRGTPKWMVKIMENPIKMNDLGAPLFSETSICIIRSFRRGYGASFLASLTGLKLAERFALNKVKASELFNDFFEVHFFFGKDYQLSSFELTSLGSMFKCHVFFFSG